MSARALPPDLRDQEGKEWVSILCRGYDGREFLRDAMVLWYRFDWTRYRTDTATRWPWEPSLEVRNAYITGNFTPWFVFQRGDCILPIILSPEAGYLLSRGVRARLWPPTGGLGDMDWIVEEYGWDIQGNLQHVGITRPLPSAYEVYSRFRIDFAAVILSRRWMARRLRRRWVADQARVALGRLRALAALDDFGTTIGTYLAGPPVYYWDYAVGTEQTRQRRVQWMVHQPAGSGLPPPWRFPSRWYGGLWHGVHSTYLGAD